MNLESVFRRALCTASDGEVETAEPRAFASRELEVTRVLVPALESPVAAATGL